MNDFYSYVIDYDFVCNVQKDILLKYKIIPIQIMDIFVLIACSNDEYKKEVSELFNLPVKYIKVDENIIDFELLYIKEKIEIFYLAEESVKFTQDLKSDKSYITKFCDVLFSFAIQENSSDIHIETMEDCLVIRLRINGVLIQFFNLTKELYPILSASIKLFSSLDISQTRLPQNGRFSQDVINKNYDFRVSIIPSIFGESIVIRILDNANAFVRLKDLGFTKDLYSVLDKNIKALKGMILITGPTGSGKTTTLYSIINEFEKDKKKIITIEDPIEYKIAGITQVNINEDIGLSYDEVLKNILRQDPDVIMIGEIRDEFALKIAIQAALTGHLVLATLHTNSAVETINRLIDLGAKEFMIASVLKLIISQRLIRTLCAKCKVGYKFKGKILFKASGCKLCSFSGYSSREVISEYLDVTNDISRLISSKTNILDIKKHANYIDIKTNSIRKVLEGSTSLEEYYKYEI